MGAIPLAMEAASERAVKIRILVPYNEEVENRFKLVEEERGRYPLGPDLSFLPGSTILSTNPKSVFAKISFEENESSLTGLGRCLL
jgi:hypothetical protein